MGVPEQLEERNDVLWNKLVPQAGPCETKEGETLRAINRIVYRYLNDGDYFYKGYGIKTAGAAHAYLMEGSPLADTIYPILEESVKGDYEGNLNKALAVVVDWIESKSEYTPNEEDMFDFPPHFTEEEEEDEDNWYDDSDEY
jgi:hypothetical protein